MNRCPWCGDDPLYVQYHDQEWGVPVFEDKKHFEFLILESAQAGLNWLTILKKRENYREAYKGFNPEVVADFKEREIERLLLDEGIIRNKRKIYASVNNARRFLEIQEEFDSFSNYLWGFFNYGPKVNRWKKINEVPAKTVLSEKISRDMKKRGFQFIGPTIIYSHLQATGLVNDHLTDCFRYKKIIDSYKDNFDIS